MNPPQKTIQVRRTRTLADGTIKVYIRSKTYEIKGRPRVDGTRTPEPRFTDEQISDITNRIVDGVPVARIAREYNCSPTTIKKLIGI